MEIRNSVDYLVWYYNGNNVPGQIMVVVHLIWINLWFENRYYGSNPVYRQSEELTANDLIENPEKVITAPRASLLGEFPIVMASSIVHEHNE